MQSEKRNDRPKRSAYERQGRSQKESYDRNLSKMWNQDVQDFGKGLLSSFFKDFRKSLNKPAPLWAGFVIIMLLICYYKIRTITQKGLVLSLAQSLINDAG